MKVKRFTVANMQVGLKTISETLGPEAVILSNRRLSDGLEIVAGVEEADYARYVDSLPPQEAPASDIIKADPESTQPLDQETMQQLFSVMSDKNKRAFGQTPSQTAAESRSKPAQNQSPAPAKATRVESLPDRHDEKPNDSDRRSFELLRQEIDGLKVLLKEQTEQLKEPTPSVNMSVQYERLEARLQALGFSGAFIRKLLTHYDREESLDTNWRQLMGRIATALPAPLYEPMSQGGVFALTGPTGAGKTTTIAKLAAHAVKKQGAESVAVVSMDWFQVGGQEILKSVTDILGVDFYPLTEQDSLQKTLQRLSSKSLVLIDTSGSADALKHWNQQTSNGALANRIQSLLVLPATMTPSAVSQFISQLRGPRFHGVVLSKVDESASFGGALEPVLRNRWPLWYITTGQNIPQDIEVADGRQLTRRLVKGLTQESTRLADVG
ncbi:flagellar biosynthesis protein FlhF [Reinekea blandensis]|uniref:Flagellar biosynthesis protein FlhF n=1 Tax=Reinekea blandensis MED297 TaxID=314283 RepID=A4BEH6_9GAMM|nr:flagellar biosynthesis protein FlhF [Reinekea blandensis]EAR09403.1 flagellar biosynthesis protein [Reinekea sp. MED297] [Reinekea blandensis MED297]